MKRAPLSTPANKRLWLSTQVIPKSEAGWKKLAQKAKDEGMYRQSTAIVDVVIGLKMYHRR